MPINFPITKITNSQRYGYCYTLQEALQLWHNAKGREFEEGKITIEEFNEWVKTEYGPLWEICRDTLLEYRTMIKIKNKYNNPQGIKIEEVIQI